MANVLSIIVTAFVTGALARFAVPGPDPMPAWLTVLIGLGGTLIGAGIVVLATGADPAWFGIAGFIASVTLVVIYRRFIQRRPLWGPDAYRFPERGVGVESYRERLHRAGIDPNSIGAPLTGATPQGLQSTLPAMPAPPMTEAGDPTENPAHYLGLLEELHDAGVLSDTEFEAVRLRLLERLRG